MKKLLSVLLALAMMLALSVMPALAEAASEAPAAEETVETVETASEEEAAPEETAEEAVEEAAAEEAEEPAEEPAKKESWASFAFGKLAGIQWFVWVVLAILVLFAFLMGRNPAKWTARKLSFAAMCIAISFILSYIRLYRMPQGGSITLVAKLPLVLFTLACGPIEGLVAGCAAGLIGLIQDPYVIHPIQMLVDYPFASGAVAIAFVAKLLPCKNDRVKYVAATALGYFGSYVMAVLSGAIFFGEYAWEGWGAWAYSFAYNASYALPECIIACIVVAILPGIDRLIKSMEKGAKK